MAGGRPSKYNKDFHIPDFIRLSKQGKTLAQIALAWDVDRDTVAEWRKRHKEFSDAIKKGREYSEAWYMNLGQMAMINEASIMENGKPKKVNVNLGYFCWMTKNLFKWSDKIENKIDHSGEIGTKENKTQSLKNIFKNEKSRELALQLAECMSKEGKNGKSSPEDS